MDDTESHRRAVRRMMAKPPFSRTGLTEREVDLLCTALTHDSYSDEALKAKSPRRVESYERLEFLGDAVLELLACEHVYVHTDLRERGMTDFKQSIVANRVISERVSEYGPNLDDVMLVGHGHMSNGRNVIGENMRADAFEALVGAIYVLYGLSEARKVVEEVLIRNGGCQAYS